MRYSRPGALKAHKRRSRPQARHRHRSPVLNPFLFRVPLSPVSREHLDRVLDYSNVELTAAPPRKVTSRQSTATPADRKHTQTSEYTPSQPITVEKDTSSPSLHKLAGIKRKASVNVVISPIATSLSSTSVALARTISKAEATKPRPSALKDSQVVDSNEEAQPQATKKRKLVKKVVDDSQPEDERPPRIKSDKPLDIISIHSQSSIKEPEVSHEKSKEPSKKSSRGRSQSRQPTPPRERSISPVTKVDTWFAVSSAKELEEEQRDNNNAPIPENICSGTVSQAVEPPAVSNSEMNPSGQVPVLFPPTLAPIHGRQLSRPQSQQSGRQSPITPVNQHQRGTSQGFAPPILHA